MQAVSTMTSLHHILTPAQGGLMQGPMCHKGLCRGLGDPGYGVVLLGIAPGQDEVKRGQPFIGASGQLLNKILKQAAWPREHTYATNLICNWNNKPTEDELMQCGARLVDEIRACHPKLIISLGQIVTHRLTGIPEGTKNVRGSVLWSKEFNCYVLTTHHPAAVYHSQSMSIAQDILRDLDKIPLILEYPDDGSVANVTYESTSDPVVAQQFLDRLPTDRNVVVDIETSSKTTDETDTDVFVDALLRIGFRYVDPVTNVERILVMRPGAWAEGLTFPQGVRWEFQFGVYDTMGIWKALGARLEIVEDLGLKSYAVDERSGRHGLKLLAREYQGAGWYDAPLEYDKKHGTMHKLPDDVVDEYNAKDVAYTGRTDDVLTQFMKRENVEGLYYDLLIPAYNMYRDAQYRGINVDHRKLIELGWDQWMPKCVEMNERLQQEARDIGFAGNAKGEINLNSYPQLRTIFFDILGFPATKLTKKGAASVDKFVMDSIDHPFAAHIREFRAIDGMMDYVFAIQGQMKLDGLLHPSAQLHTVRTGRRSYKNPAMQTIPEPFTVGAEYAQIQEVFIPHNPRTHRMLKVDYEQIEVWTAWAFSRDPVLLEHLLSGDVHSATAETALGVDRHNYGYPYHRKNPAWEFLRQTAKKIRFGLQYGEGAERLATPPPIGIGGTKEQAQEFIDRYWAGYRVYAAWVKMIQRKCIEEGELVSPTGRKMRFPMVLDHRELRQAVNFPIQSPASDHVLLSALELAEKLLEYNSFFLIDVHDAMWIEYDIRYEAQVCRTIRDVMERPKWGGWPNIPVEIKVGPNIGQMEKVPREYDWSLQCAA